MLIVNVCNILCFKLSLFGEPTSQDPIRLKHSGTIWIGLVPCALIIMIHGIISLGSTLPCTIWVVISARNMDSGHESKRVFHPVSWWQAYCCTVGYGSSKIQMFMGMGRLLLGLPLLLDYDEIKKIYQQHLIRNMSKSSTIHVLIQEMNTAAQEFHDVLKIYSNMASQPPPSDQNTDAIAISKVLWMQSKN